MAIIPQSSGLRRLILDTLLFDTIEEEGPQVNPRILEGLAVEHLRPERVRRYIERIIRCAQESFPIGLEFVGSARCTPIEEYNVVTRNKTFRGTKKRIFDLSRSDVYLQKFMFRYEGRAYEPFYLYLPFVHKGGLMRIRGKLWGVSPVLADKLFSVSPDDIYIPMPRGKVTFERVTTSIKVDGTRVPTKVVHSRLHNKKLLKGKKPRSDLVTLSGVKTPMAAYLAARYGVTEMFKSLLGCSEVIIADQHDTGKYPPDRYIVAESSGIKPQTCRVRGGGWFAPKVVFIFKREEFTPLVRDVVAGLFYILEHFPDHTDITSIDTAWLWRLFIGYMLWGETPGSGKLVEDINNHLNSLDGYVDFEVRRTMENNGLNCKTIYELFVYVIENMERMIMESSGSVSSMYGKQFMVLKYVLADINNSIFGMLFSLTSSGKKPLTRDTIEEILRKHFRYDLIFDLTKGKSHGEMSSVSSPTDNMYFKITAVMIPQSETAGRGKNADSRPADASTMLNASQAEVAGFCVLPKSSPFGRNRINPFLLDDPETGDIIRRPEFVELIDRTNNEIKR